MLPPPIEKLVISFELRTLVQLYGLAHYYLPRKQLPTSQTTQNLNVTPKRVARGPAQPHKAPAVA